jgi:hypothetical protein
VFFVGCLLVGHNDMLVREAGRMWLRCHQCGRDTPGWSVGRPAAPIRQEGPRCDEAGAAVLFAASRLIERPLAAQKCS